MPLWGHRPLQVFTHTQKKKIQRSAFFFFLPRKNSTTWTALRFRSIAAYFSHLKINIAPFQKKDRSKRWDVVHGPKELSWFDTASNKLYLNLHYI